MKNYKHYHTQKGEEFGLMIYYGSDGSGDKMYHYIRLQNIETDKFPHGISIGAAKFENKADADKYRNQIAEYLGFTEIED